LHQIRQFWLAQSVEIYSGLIKSALVPTKNYAREPSNTRAVTRRLGCL